MAYRILAVDDEPVLQRLVQEILEGAGYTVALASNCAQAMERLRAFSPDAVLLDVMLSDGDGFTLFERIQKICDVPVLFLSARDEDEARLRGLGLGQMTTSPSPFCRKSCCYGLGLSCAVCTAAAGKSINWEKPRSFGAKAPCARMGQRSS